MNKGFNKGFPRLHMGCGESLRSRLLRAVGMPRPPRKVDDKLPRGRNGK